MLGVGKQQVDTWYNETSTAKRKTTEVERQAEETEEARVRREVTNLELIFTPSSLLGETHAYHPQLYPADAFFFVLTRCLASCGAAKGYQGRVGHGQICVLLCAL